MNNKQNPETLADLKPAMIAFTLLLGMKNKQKPTKPTLGTNHANETNHTNCLGRREAFIMAPTA
jgi:hypothetical protein